MSVVSATVIVPGTILAVPSKDVPPIVLAVAKAVAVAAFPVVEPDDPETSPVTSPVMSPTNAVEVTLVRPVIVVSRLRVTSPDVPPPFKFVPAVTPVISPVVGLSACHPLVVSYVNTSPSDGLIEP